MKRNGLHPRRRIGRILRPKLTKKQQRLVDARAFLDELEATNTLVAIHIRHLKRLIRRARFEGLWPGIVP